MSTPATPLSPQPPLPPPVAAPAPASPHLLLAFASCVAADARQRLAQLKLPHLERLLALLSCVQRDVGSELSLTPPHERALARLAGLSAPDGLLPWAAWQREQIARDAGTRVWAWLTPCHWQVGSDQIIMDDPEQLRLHPNEAHDLIEAMMPYFAHDGLELGYDMAAQWWVCGAYLEDVPLASPDRVIGRNVSPWMPSGVAGRDLRRLQNEMQMLLYQHPVNERRSERGLPPVNSFWISGAGRLPDNTRALPAALTVDTRLRRAALNADWDAWASTWQQLDQEQCAPLCDLAERGQPLALTLCGERSAHHYVSKRLAKLRGWLAGLASNTRVKDTLEAL